MALIGYEEDDDHNSGETLSAPSFASAPLSVDDAYAKLSEQAKALGVDMEASYRDDLSHEYQGVNGQGARTTADIYAGLSEQLKKRAASTSHREADSQSERGNALYGSGTGNDKNIPGGPFTPTKKATVPAFQNTTPQFTDPSQQLIENYALDRFRQLQNPDPQSGTALYEDYARKLAETLQAPINTASDEAVLRTKAFDSLEQDRASTKQKWMQELSRRGIAPSSGIALDGLRRIDGEFDKARGSLTNALAVDAIGATRQNRMNALSVLNNLQGSENTRLNNALSFAQVPYNMGNEAFSQGLSLVNAGGNANANAQTALQLATAIQNNQNLNAQQRSQMIASIFEWIGEAF